MHTLHRLLGLAALLLTPTLALADVYHLDADGDGSQEVPPVATAGVSTAWITVDDATGQVQITGTYSGLNGNATACHLHGPAGPGQNGGILVICSTTGGTSGTFSGTGNLSASDITEILAGNSYLNVHSTLHGAGEVRGQALQPNRVVNFTLDGTQAGTGSTAIGAGVATLNPNTNELTIDGTFSGLTTIANNAHLHGPAWFGQNGGILMPITTTNALAGTFSGQTILGDQDEASFFDGQTYVNIHNSSHPGGEIRGQVWDDRPGRNYCQAVANSSGQPARILATGPPFAAFNNLSLSCTQLPPNQFAYIIASREPGQLFPVSGSSGRLCVVASDIARFLGTLGTSDAGGLFLADPSLILAPFNPPTTVMTGDTINFQCWFRDTGASPSSNFTDAVSITWR